MADFTGALRVMAYPGNCSLFPAIFADTLKASEAAARRSLSYDMPSSVNWNLILFAFLLGPAAMLTRADWIVLKDGDRVSGKILKKDGKNVTIQSRHFGTLTVPWESVAAVETDQPVNVVLPNEETFKASLQTRNGQIQVAPEEGTPRTVRPSEILALRNNAEQRTYERLLRPGIMDLWAITGSFNIAGATGNADTSTLTTPLNLVRESRTSRTAMYFNLIRSTALVDDVEGETAKAVRGGWSFSRNVLRKLSVRGFNDYEFDKFQALDLRTVFGIGLGWELWHAERASLALVGGSAWNREKFDPTDGDPFVRNSSEGYWGNDLNYSLSSRTNLVQGFRMFNNLSKRGEYRMNFDVAAKTKLSRWLDWNVTLSDRFLSNPVEGRLNNDFLYSTGLGFSFAR